MTVRVPQMPQSAIASPLIAPARVISPAAHVVPPTTPRSVSVDLPDILDGGARRRRALFFVLALAALALFGAIALSVASQYRPM